MPHKVRRTIKLADERAQTMAEYALLVGLIAAAVAVTLPIFGSSVSGLFQSFTNAM
jgi:Flp pilus assembly pilin Flp